MSNPDAKYRIQLTPSQRQELIDISKNGTRSAQEVYHANVLLMADDNAAEGRWREDYHYERNGTQSIFMFIDPHRGWRRVSNRARRTSIDWAEEIEHLLEVDYPDSPKIQLVSDNLNTHHIASLYAAFPAPKAHRLAQRIEMHHRPRNGSWLNIAEIELSVLERQCLERRMATAEQLKGELESWQQERNREKAVVKWQFTTEDARIKLHHLYPQF